MLSDDLENWMKNLDLQLTTLPIIYLAIPGSHDSMSYGIDSHSKPAPDAEREIVQLYKILPCVVRRWARTQSLSITEQLSIGIRYFDLRIARHSFYCDYYFVHGLYCENVEHPFNEMRNFLKSHPKEFVILDFQHFYNFNVDDHNALCKTILYYFGDVIFEKRESLLMCNLNIARQMKKQVLIIYREFLPDSTIFWNSHEWPTPWPNKVNIKSLKQYLTDSLHERKPDQGFVTQVVLTPDAHYIVPRFISSLKTKCAKKVIRKLSGWISNQTPGQFQSCEVPKSNVFIADFVELNDNKFSKLVVDLNEKIKVNKL